MNANIAVDFEDGTDPKEIESVLGSIRKQHPDVQIQIEEPKGVVPVNETFMLVVGVNASLQTLAVLYPQLQRLFKRIGGETNMMNTTEIAIEYINEDSRANRKDLNLINRDITDSHIKMTFVDESTGSEHSISIDEHNPEDWEYEGT